MASIQAACDSCKHITALSTPYAPELNPTEQVWELLKQNHFSNCFFDGYDLLLDACCNAWNALT